MDCAITHPLSGFISHLLEVLVEGEELIVAQAGEGLGLLCSSLEASLQNIVEGVDMSEKVNQRV